MFFWIGLAVMLVLFVGFVSWGVRGYQGRVHKPGTTHMRPPVRDSRRGSDGVG
jgi:hypothetical protein